MPPAPPKAAECVIVGGGCMGASTAFHLARRGVDVVLLERHHIASGATGHSGALVRQAYEARIGVRLARAALKFFQGFEEVTGYPCDFVQTGFLMGARPRDAAALERFAALLRSEGVDARVVEPSEAKALEPQLAVDDLAGAMFDPEAGYADPILTAAAFSRAAEESGARIIEDTAVRGITKLRDGLSVRTSRGSVAARTVVAAAGPLTNGLLPRGAPKIPMHFEPGPVAMFRRPAEAESPPRLHFDVYGNTYSRPEGARDVLVGYLDEKARARLARPEPFDPTLPIAMVRDLQARIAKRFPMMARGQPRGGWLGVYDVTPDAYPVVDRVADGVYVCAGFSGHGFKLSPRVGELLAEFAATGRRPADLEPLQASRFAEKRLVKPDAPFPSRRGRRIP